MLGGAPGEPGKRESESMRSIRWEGFPGWVSCHKNLRVFVTMVTVENESQEGAWPGSGLIEGMLRLILMKSAEV